MKRKITALLLSAVLLLSLCGAPAVLADEAEAGAIQPDPVGSQPGPAAAGEQLQPAGPGGDHRLHPVHRLRPDGGHPAG